MTGAFDCDPRENREYLDSWEQFVSELLSKHFEAFGLRDLDGLSPVMQKKVSPLEAHLFATSWLIEDQTKSPLCLEVECDPDSDLFTKIRLRWGEADLGHGRLVRTDYSDKELAQLAFAPDSIPWRYHVWYSRPSRPKARMTAVCLGCPSLFLAEPTTAEKLCSECRPGSSERPLCDHQFVLGRCGLCYWDGSLPHEGGA